MIESLFSNRPAKSHILFFLIFILISAVWIRGYTLLKNELIFDGDEALVGLQAKHINQKKITPVFVYGQDYMGSFEAYTAAVFYSLFGESIISLKAAPAFYSVLLIFFVFILVFKISGWRPTALIVLFWTAPPYLPLYWSLSPTGGHIENILFSVILLILIYKYFESETNIFFFCFWIIAGFAFWINPFSMFIPIAFLLTFVWKNIGRGNYKKLRLLILALAFFCFGCLPLIHYNLVNEFITFKKLAGFFLGISRGAYQSSAQIHILIFEKLTGMLAAVPVGIFKLSTGIIRESGNFYFDGFLFFCAIIYVIFYGLKKKDYFFKTIALLALIICVMFSISSRAADRPRYMLVFYPVITIGIALLLKNAENYFKKNFKIIPYIILIIIICVNIMVILKKDKIAENKAFFKKYKMTQMFLEQQNIRYVYADMYIAYPLVFLSGEKIIASPYAGFYNEDRITEYTEKVKQEQSNTFIFFRDSYSSNSLISRLNFLNVNFQKHTISDFDIFFGFSEYVDVDKLDLPKRFRKR